jgi:hypothetical protein
MLHKFKQSTSPVGNSGGAAAARSLLSKFEGEFSPSAAAEEIKRDETQRSGEEASAAVVRVLIFWTAYFKRAGQQKWRVCLASVWIIGEVISGENEGRRNEEQTAETHKAAGSDALIPPLSFRTRRARLDARPFTKELIIARTLAAKK